MKKNKRKLVAVLACRNQSSRLYGKPLQFLDVKNEIRVITIKPGFVDTNMTKGLNKNFLWSSPEKVARGIKGAIDNKKDVVYLPGYWKYIMYIIKLISGFIFKKLSL